MPVNFNFIGSLCERRRSCDDDKACLNGGKCVGNSVGDKTKSTCGKGLQKEICTMEDSPNYHCECQTGFSGHWCEKTNACHPMKVKRSRRMEANIRNYHISVSSLRPD